MRGNTDPQEEEDQLHPAANRSAGESLLRDEVSWHLPAGETGGADRTSGVKNSGNAGHRNSTSKGLKFFIVGSTILYFFLSQVWFQNRRAKSRRQVGSSVPLKVANSPAAGPFSQLHSRMGPEKGNHFCHRFGFGVNITFFSVTHLRG